MLYGLNSARSLAWERLKICLYKKKGFYTECCLKSKPYVLSTLVNGVTYRFKAMWPFSLEHLRGMGYPIVAQYVLWSRGKITQAVLRAIGGSPSKHGLLRALGRK